MCERDSNCRPWSVIMTTGAPKLATHPARKAAAVASAVISCIGVAVAQRVVLSMHVRIYRWPHDAVRGPTISKWTV